MSRTPPSSDRLRDLQLGAAVLATVPAAICAVAWGAAGTQLLMPLLTAAGVVATAAAARRPHTPTTLSVIWPALWWPFIYVANIDAVLQIDPSWFIDDTLAAWDAALLGRGSDGPAWQLGGPVEELGNAFYVSFFFLVPSALVWAWRSRGEHAALQHGLTLLGSIGLCSAVWLVFPAGGFHETGSPDTHGTGPATAFAHWVYDVNPHFAGAFPSAHVANATGCATLIALLGGGRLWPLWALGVGFGAVYGQYHYFVDIPPGLLIGAGVAWWVSRIGSAPVEP